MTAALGPGLRPYCQHHATGGELKVSDLIWRLPCACGRVADGFRQVIGGFSASHTADKCIERTIQAKARGPDRADGEPIRAARDGPDRAEPEVRMRKADGRDRERGRRLRGVSLGPGMHRADEEARHLTQGDLLP
jgi:hypothetical protein